MNWIMSFEILALSHVADKLSNEWAGPLYSTLVPFHILNKLSSDWAVSRKRLKTYSRDRPVGKMRSCHS